MTNLLKNDEFALKIGKHVLEHFESFYKGKTLTSQLTVPFEFLVFDERVVKMSVTYQMPYFFIDGKFITLSEVINLDLKVKND